MEKMRMESMDIVAQNVENIGNLFPDCITEARDENGKIQKVVDRDRLMQKFSHKIIRGGTTERYEFTWVGKNASRVEANTTTNKTLRPCIEESKDWDNTENLYIEGDNLEVLKLLQNSYFNKVKMIYIDPPYNTGNDFIYIDDFAQNIDEYEEAKGSFDEEGNRLFKNTDTNGRFHSDWCSMIYPRLVLARNLLANDGVIFISIDDNEQENLKKICDEVFGEKNFIAQVIWERAYAPVNLKKHFSENHDYIICYAKDIDKAICNGLPRASEANDRYSNPDNDPRGIWKSDNLSVGPIVQSKIYEIITPGGRKVLPPEGYCWRLSKEKFKEFVKDNRIWFGKDGNNVPSIKRFLTEVKQSITPMTIWKYSEVGHSQDAKQNLKKLFDGKSFFDYPKSVELIKRCIQLYSNESSIIIDFFSGSATTAHAVMQLNAEDGGKRKFIMVQLPEKTDEKSEAFKAGYKNICEIGKERIRRAGEKIKEEAGLNGQDLDIGFRVLKLDSSNMKDIYYSADEYDQGMLENMQSNTKEDRTDLDLLFGCLVDWGLELDKPYTIKEINGHKVHIYNDGDLVACFEKDLDMKTIDEIAKLQALRVVFSDNSFVDSATKINVAEHFKMIAPDSDIKVI
ncbi:site-specific DNA-methyltransferase [Megamonas rupellensis]|uniref:Site-specific DNA-methyltransferase n=2 Tax=Megamonas TaxID=158846 RepID=A0A412CG46_9FIRM|nr:site-specific DNA-methyltransferase [Megamonas rupellensis]RGQ85512.1 site-specific DNA-methyltransferase [Megamonas rupellensis]